MDGRVFLGEAHIRLYNRGMTKLPLLPQTLPCVPCPHDAKCCSYGTSLTAVEVGMLIEEFGVGVVRYDEEGREWRTVVEGSRCIFQQGDGRCRIHDHPAYPVTCRLFPWADVDGGPYQGELSICPELP